MINNSFLNIIEQEKWCIEGILFNILQIPTYSAFFNQKGIGISYKDFIVNGNSIKSPKVIEFVEKHQSTSNIIGALNFIEYLINHNSDNILKEVIEANVAHGSNCSTGIEQFKKMFYEFKSGFLNETTIPYIINLSASVLSDKSYSSVLGREKELKELTRQFGKIMKNNVVLTGNGGVGKTAIVEEFAYRHTSDVTVYELNVLGLIAKGKEATSIFEEILIGLTNLSGNKVLFIDEFHILVKEGLADAIKRLTSRATDLKFVVATTTEEFKLYIEKDKALERRFYPIPVKELEGEILKEVLTNWTEKLANHFSIDYDRAIIDFVMDKMSVERQKTSPDKEKDVLDAAFSGCKLDGINKVDKSCVADVMGMRLNIPSKQLLSSMFDVVLKLEDNLKAEVKGQDYAIKNIVRVIESSQMRKKKNKPMSVMFFAGPSSVGKTEIARQLAKNMFGSAKNLIQIDCTNFKEQHTVSALLGSPPGYVGSEAGGKLVNDIKEKPFSVLLFDEFEKAHKDVHDILLPMFEEGVIIDRLGREVSVSNCIIILTSNIGADIDYKKETSKSIDIGFNRSTSEEMYETNQISGTERYKHYLKNMKKSLKPELLARINEIVIFEKIDNTVIKEIIEKQLQELVDFYAKDFDMDISYTTGIIDYISKKSENNPRRVASLLEKFIQSVITKAYIKQEISEGSKFEIFVLEEKAIALNIEQ